MRRIGSLLGCLVILVGLRPAALTAQPPDEAPTARPGVTTDVLDQIQRRCLSVYPPDLLKATLGHAPREEDLESGAPMKTEKGLFHTVLLEAVKPAFDAYVRPGSTFLDLGSGDGRVVFMASLYGARATGIEYDEQLDDVSRQALDALEDMVDRELVDLRRGDFFEVSWSDFDVVYYYDVGSFEDGRLETKIARELGPSARFLVSHESQPFPGLTREAKIGAVTVYRQPDSPAAGGGLQGLSGLAAGLVTIGLLAVVWLILRRRRPPARTS